MLEELKDAIRDLVSEMYRDLHGAYGSGDCGYQGEYEGEIGKLAETIIKIIAASNATGMAKQDESQERSRWLNALDDYVLEHHTDIYEGWHEQEGQGGDIDEYLEIFYPGRAKEILREFQATYGG